MTTSTSSQPAAIRFDRNELSGAFGDIGTDMPLVVGMILAAGLDSASVFIMFGLMQIVTALFYRMPMPVQPLKAVAAIVITQRLAGSTLYGAGLAIGLTMLLLTATGLIDWLARVVPKSVIRGIQFGLGLQLASLALKEYVPADGSMGYVLAAAGFLLTLVFLGNRRFPPALFVVALGVVYAMIFKLDTASLAQGVNIRLPQFHAVTPSDVVTGFVTLALAQIPLSLGNSILATQQTAQDLFPERPVSIRKIGFTYSLMNLVNPFFGGVPTCHGAGGLVGHYTFGGRTGGSVIIYGTIYIILGLFLSGVLESVIQIFPRPILGVLLFFEALAMMLLARDVSENQADFAIAFAVGLIILGLPYGYLIGLVVGVALAHFGKERLQGLGK